MKGWNFIFTTLILPDHSDLDIETIQKAGQTLQISIIPLNLSAACPGCKQSANRVHSRYTRTLADLPLNIFKVSLLLEVRRFRCLNSECQRKFFSEQIPQLAKRYARRTLRQAQQLEQIALAVGGRPGSRLAKKLGLDFSSFNTLIRFIRAKSLPHFETPKLLGVDDFAFRKGHTYGSILVDLTLHRPIEVFKDREADTFASWLKQHPGVEVITRDRAGAYAEGARRGAPSALQVADRFHLVSNLASSVERIVDRTRPEWEEGLATIPALALEPLHQHSQSSGEKSGVVAVQDSKETIPTQLQKAKVKPPTPTQLKQQIRHSRRQARFEQVKELHQRGYTYSAISKAVGLHRDTVRNWIEIGGLPQGIRTRQRQSKKLGPYKAYLVQRWQEGNVNGKMLSEEIKQQGYRGGKTIVYEFIRQLQPQLPKLLGPNELKSKQEKLSTRQVVWLLMGREDKFNSEQLDRLKRLRQASRHLETTYQLAQSFIGLLRERNVGGWGDWLEAVKASKLNEFNSFSAGLLKDEKAVKAAMMSELSNGQTEGQVNRIKTIKRSMNGRAKFDLLRARILQAA